MDTPSRLMLFVDVVEHGSFAKAADLRNVDRSVVSKQISKLESDLGVRLLNRSTRSLSPTSVGLEMLKQGKTLRELMKQTSVLAENFQDEPRGLLRITSTTSFGRQYVHAAVAAFQRQYPDVEVELRLEDRRVDLIGEGYDLGIRIGIPQDSNLIARPLAKIGLVIVASPEFLEQHGVPKTIEDLARLPAITYSGANRNNNQIHYYDEQGEEQSMTMRSVFRTNEGETMIAAAKAGQGYAALGRFMLGTEVACGNLIPIMTGIKLTDYIGDAYIIYPHRDLPVRTRLFIETLQNMIGEPPVWEREIADCDCPHQIVARRKQSC
ncbi:MAG: LysR family transcriptional regulator [Marinobacterium sp.]|nr:LysR family transcriptional regulator [Marinobacterium sp.]